MKQSDYTWKGEWIIPFESVWGILERFKYANAMTGLYIRKYINSYNNVTYDIRPQQYHYVYRITKYDVYKLNDILELNPQHFDAISIFHFNEYRLFLDSDIRICPICMKNVFFIM